MILKLRCHDCSYCPILAISFLALDRLLFRIAYLVLSGWWLPGISRLHVDNEQGARLKPLASRPAVFKFVRLPHTRQRRGTTLALVNRAEQLRSLAPFDPRYDAARFTSEDNFHSGIWWTLPWRRGKNYWYGCHLTGQFLFRCIRHRTIHLVSCRSRTIIGYGDKI